jgi:hypothetical protein
MGGPQRVHRIYAQEKTMEIPQLKLLAGRVRGLLQQSSSLIGHSKALDLVAAVPGLRNWPEVMAFPDRVAACELDTASAGRLAFRLNKNYALEVTAKDLLSALAPDSPGPSQGALQVWPGGPPPGVYVTTSAQAISALLARYEEATDGGLVYAERAGSGWEGSIDLGENGLWSAGIDRLPSGTLLVVGPIELDQESWDDAAQRLEMACLHALNSDHRVSVLVKTPTPDMLCEDLVVLLQSASDEPSDTESALVGLVAENGELQRRQPFAGAYRKPVAISANVGLEALPVSTREALSRELAIHTAGIVLFGSSEIADHTAYDQLAAGLALTEHAGAAARIMPRHRGTPAKDWLVPEPIKALPFLPSIESAYAQGYRRMVISPHYSRGDALLDYDDVLFLGGTYGHGVADIALRVVTGSYQNESKILERIVAVLGLFPLAGRRGQVVASDLFVRGTLPGPVGSEYSEFETFLRANRAVRWEEELASLLDTGAVTMTGIKKAGHRHHSVTEFLAQRRTVKKAS